MRQLSLIAILSAVILAATAMRLIVDCRVRQLPPELQSLECRLDGGRMLMLTFVAAGHTYYVVAGDGEVSAIHSGDCDCRFE